VDTVNIKCLVLKHSQNSAALIQNRHIIWYKSLFLVKKPAGTGIQMQNFEKVARGRENTALPIAIRVPACQSLPASTMVCCATRTWTTTMDTLWLRHGGIETCRRRSRPESDRGKFVIGGMRFTHTSGCGKFRKSHISNQ
jgi:hypothetical protein